jgi:hypothetical protein
MSVYERLMSECEEILNADCFKGVSARVHYVCRKLSSIDSLAAVTHVYELREDDPDNIPIPPDTFFQRYRVNTETGIVFPPNNRCLPRCQTVYHLTVPQMSGCKAELAAFYHENAFHSRKPTLYVHYMHISGAALS